jgi:hypothetical protein
LLGEVVGGPNIDWLGKASDQQIFQVQVLEPYCTIQIGLRLSHQTKKGEGGTNTTWTVATSAFFLFEMMPLTIAQKTLTSSALVQGKHPFAADGAGNNLSGNGDHSVADLFCSHDMEEQIDLLLFISNMSQPYKQPTDAATKARPVRKKWLLFPVGL